MGETAPRLQAAEISVGAGVVTARVHGSAIEQHRAAALGNAILKAVEDAGDCRYVVLDLGAVSFINSTGIAGLIELRNALETRGVTSILYRPDRNLRDVLHKTRVDRLFAVAGTAAELEQAIGGGP